MNTSTRFLIRGLALLLAIVAVNGSADGAMTLTAAGSSAGFSLSTFADGFPSNPGGVGPVGIAITPAGQVMISDYAYGYPSVNQARNAVFADVDNQHYSTDATFSSTAGFVLYGPSGIAVVGSHIYQAQQSGNQVAEIDASGNYLQKIVDFGAAVSLVANPANGHLFSSSGSSVLDIDPIAKSFTVFSNTNWDGMAITPDGKILYGANFNTGNIEGYDTATKALVFQSGAISGYGTIDGSALGTGVLAGNIFVNTNGGAIIEVNLTTKVQTVIATGGSRGDFVSVDTNNGTLLLTQSNSVLRLTAPAGGGFGDGNAVPEPTTLAIWGLGALGFAVAGFRRRKTS